MTRRRSSNINNGGGDVGAGSRSRDQNQDDGHVGKGERQGEENSDDENKEHYIRMHQFLTGREQGGVKPVYGVTSYVSRPSTIFRTQSNINTLISVP